MRHTIYAFLILAFIWFFNSGHNTPLLISFGVISIGFVLWIAHRMDIVDHESQPIHLTMKLPAYYWWLIGQIVRSNLDVVRRVWRGNGAISPCIGSVYASQKTALGRVLYANSITLTPGTVAIALEGDVIVVHSLTREGLAELRSGKMDRRISELE